MKLTPQDVQSLKDTSKWAGFTYVDDEAEGGKIGSGKQDKVDVDDGSGW